MTTEFAEPLQARPHRKGLWTLGLAPIIVAAGFGPYVIGKIIRPEHILLYATFPIALGIVAMRRRTVLQLPAIAIQGAILGAIITWAMIVTVVLDGTGALFRLSTIARAESFAQPLVVLVVLAACLPFRADFSANALLRNCCNVLVVILAVNSGLTIVHVVYDVSWFFDAFQPSGGSVRGSVWERALRMGRYTGIFGTPFESGLCYSLGLLAWGFIYRTASKPSVFLIASLPLLVVGALLSVSKVSLFIGLPLFVLFLTSGRGLLSRFVNRRNLAMLIVVLAATTAAIPVLTQWRGSARLTRLWQGTSSGDWLRLYTAGRYAGLTEGEGLTEGFGLVRRISPLAGVGFARPLIVDSAALDLYAIGGVPALVMYGVMLAAVLSLAVRHRRSLEGRFLLLSLALVAAAGLGGPVITKNRFSTAYWVLFVLLAMVLHQRHTQLPQSSGRTNLQH